MCMQILLNTVLNIISYNLLLIDNTIKERNKTKTKWRLCNDYRYRNISKKPRELDMRKYSADKEEVIEVNLRIISKRYL